MGGCDVALTVGGGDSIFLGVGGQDAPIGVGASEFFAYPANLDYEGLENLPTLDGREIVGDVREQDPTVPAWAKSDTRPAYTAEDVGAMAADELTDMNIDSLERLWASL